MKHLSLQRLVYLMLLGFWAFQGCSQQATNPKDAGAGSKANAPLQWLTELNAAYAQAGETQKPILVYFTSSDTCGACKQLDTQVFADPLFNTWAEKNVVLYKVDFADQKQMLQGDREQSAAMAQALKVSTYPTIWIIRVTHEVDNGRFKVKPMGYTGYQPTPEKFIGALQNFVHSPGRVNE